MKTETIFGLSTETVSAGAAVVTALIALLAAIFAARQVREARRLREEQAQPLVVFDIAPNPTSRSILEMTIQNVGLTVATDVQVAIDPPLRSALYPEANFSEWTVFKAGIPAMTPRKEFTAIFDSAPMRHNAGIHDVYDVRVTYADVRGVRMTPLSFTVDLAPYYGGPHYLGLKTINDVADSLRRISDDLRKVIDSGMVRVMGVDAAAHYEREEREAREWLAQQAREEGAD